LNHGKDRTVVQFHVHLVSDATGETLSAVAKAACAQFELVRPIDHTYALVRSPRQLERVLAEIEIAPGIVMFTLINPILRHRLEERCAQLGVPCVAILDPVIGALRSFLGTKEHLDKPGIQHELDAGYFRRIEALTFSMAHDDGQNMANLNEADIVLVGVSRTSKTPTCVYLANRGIKAANVPIVPGVRLPSELEALDHPLVVGLTVGPERLVAIRRNRLASMNEEDLETDYVDLDMVRTEMNAARRVFAIHGWPVIDVTRRSIEETAAAILNLYQRPVES
jgi:[pyruvate, water dikinase]-phosphate phosphotransferase / [pyruvate, water dikinase] kinase